MNNLEEVLSITIKLYTICIISLSCLIFLIPHFRRFCVSTRSLVPKDLYMSS